MPHNPGGERENLFACVSAFPAGRAPSPKFENPKSFFLFLFSLGRRSLHPVDHTFAHPFKLCRRFCSLSISVTISHLSALYRPFKMPHTNGNAGAATQSTFFGQVLDYTKALEVLDEYEERDGLDIQSLLDSKKHGGLTYNDFLVLPGYIGFAASDVSLDSPVTKRISLKTPFVSSPMDTVTEHEMAIHMALQGGLGVIHHNCSMDAQAEMVQKVKRFENGFIVDPVVIARNTSVGEVKALKEKWGFGGFPVTGEHPPINLFLKHFYDYYQFQITFVHPY